MGIRSFGLWFALFVAGLAPVPCFAQEEGAETADSAVSGDTDVVSPTSPVTDEPPVDDGADAPPSGDTGSPSSSREVDRGEPASDAVTAADDVARAYPEEFEEEPDPEVDLGLAPEDGMEAPCQELVWQLFFLRAADEETPLTEDQEAYFNVLWECLRYERERGTEQRQLRDVADAFEVRKLMRLYVFLVSTQGGLDITGVSARFQRLSGGRPFTRYSTRETVNHMILRSWRTSLGDFLLELHPASMRRYASAIITSLRAMRARRGMSLYDLCLVYILAHHGGGFRMDYVRENSEWDASATGFSPENIFTAKTSPSLEYNNMVAGELARPIPWEQLGMNNYQGGWMHIRGFHDWLARYSYENPGSIQRIPLIGHCWAAADSICTLYEGRDGSGANVPWYRAAAQLTGNLGLAFLDATLATGIAKLGYHGVRAGIQVAPHVQTAITRMGSRLANGGRELAVTTWQGSVRQASRLGSWARTRVSQGWSAIRTRVARRLAPMNRVSNTQLRQMPRQLAETITPNGRAVVGSRPGLFVHEEAMVEILEANTGQTFAYGGKAAAAVEGRLGSTPVSFYGTNGTNFKSFLDKMNKVSTVAKDRGLSGIDLYISAPNWNAARVIEVASESPVMQRIFREGAVKAVKVLTGDGRLITVLPRAL